MTKPPNDFESELDIAAMKYAGGEEQLPCNGILLWPRDEKIFKAGARWGYERGKAERDALSALCDMLAPQKVTDGIINMQKELTEARAELAEACIARDQWRKTEIERNKLRALAARMAEALRDVKPNLERIQREIDQCKSTYGMTFYPTIGTRHLIGTEETIAAYEAFERENK